MTSNPAICPNATPNQPTSIIHHKYPSFPLPHLPLVPNTALLHLRISNFSRPLPPLVTLPPPPPQTPRGITSQIQAEKGIALILPLYARQQHPLRGIHPERRIIYLSSPHDKHPTYKGVRPRKLDSLLERGHPHRFRGRNLSRKRRRVLPGHDDVEAVLQGPKLGRDRVPRLAAHYHGIDRVGRRLDHVGRVTTCMPLFVTGTGRFTCGETRVVTRAKYCISLRRPVHGMVPFRPMPMLRVAATMSVNSGCIVRLVMSRGGSARCVGCVGVECWCGTKWVSREHLHHYYYFKMARDSEK